MLARLSSPIWYSTMLAMPRLADTAVTVPVMAHSEPEAASAADTADGAQNQRTTFTVPELCAHVQDTIRQRFPDEVWVDGAISGLTRSGNGHVYFDLVDPSDEMGRSTDAVLPVALFASSRQLVNRILRKAGGVRMSDGVEIRVRGRIDYYPPQGRVQLVMSLIDPRFTLGQLAAARAKLLAQLADEGLLGANGQLDFPALPLRVGLVTSGGSAAFHDVVHQLHLSGYPFEITLFDSRVQGLDAVDSLVDAVEATTTIDLDVVMMVRGGGARTDLVAFDHERVARAIATCRHPVIIGVGHETDRSVADDVAMISAKTPTAAAATLVDTVAQFDEAVTQATTRLVALARARVDAAGDRLVADGGRLVATAVRRVEGQRADIELAAGRVVRAPTLATERANHRLAVASARLSALDPATALRRGWSITHTADGELVRSADQVSAGTRLRTTTLDGGIDSTVTAAATSNRTPGP